MSDEQNVSAPVEGGADWESGAAADAVTRAGQAWIEDPTPEHLAAYNKALRDVNAALGTRATQILNNTMRPMLIILQKISDDQDAAKIVQQETRGEVADLARQFVTERDLWEAYRNAMLMWRSELRNDFNTYKDALSKEFDTLRDDVSGFMLTQESFNAQSRADRIELRAIINQLPQSEQLGVIKQLQQDFSEFKDEARRRWQKQRVYDALLFVTITAIVLVFVLAVLSRGSQ